MKKWFKDRYILVILVAMLIVILVPSGLYIINHYISTTSTPETDYHYETFQPTEAPSDWIDYDGLSDDAPVNGGEVVEFEFDAEEYEALKEQE